MILYDNIHALDELNFENLTAWTGRLLKLQIASVDAL